MMRHGSLFSGIGGFDLASTWNGWENIFNCERDPFCQKILKHYWPKAQNYGDIFGFDATGYRSNVDVISCGFPCQPFSAAGKRRGEKDDRYLWPEARRVIMQARPSWIVLENVAGLFTILERQSLSEMEIEEAELFCPDDQQRGNRRIIRIQRRIIGRIVDEIASAGYLLPTLKDGTPIILCLPAAALDAPHVRARIFLIAHADYDGAHGTEVRPCDQKGADGDKTGTKTAFESEGRGCPADRVAPAHSYGFGQFQRWMHEKGCADAGQFTGGSDPWDIRNPWKNFPDQPPVCGRDDGLSFKLDGMSFSKWRNESLRAYGNAVVPQIAYQLFRAIEAVDSF